MKRALAWPLVVLGIRCAVACSPFDSGGGTASALDAGTSSGADARGADAASESPDASAFCDQALACDVFDGSYGSEWKLVSGDLYQPTVNGGRLVSALDSNSADTTTSGDACRLERSLPVNKKMRIEFDLTFYAPSDYRDHNIQVFALYNGTGSTRTYLGLYIQNPSADHASLVLSVAHETGGPTIVGTGTIDYGVTTRIAVDVSFGSGSAVRLDSAGATEGTQAFTTLDDQALTLLLGAARQNGGSDALRAEYDDFRVLPITSF